MNPVMIELKCTYLHLIWCNFLRKRGKFKLQREKMETMEVKDLKGTGPHKLKTGMN